MFRSIAPMTITALLLCTASVAVETFQARVTGVSAADIFSIRHQGQENLVVLYGVTAQSTKTLAGQEAQRFASEKVLRKSVTVRVIDRRAGMTLVEFDLEDGTNLGQLLLRKGLVKWDSLSAPHDENLKDLQRLAKADHRGLWYDPEVLHNPQPEPQIEEAEVVSTPPSPRGRDRGEYRVLEERTLTDASGTKTLIMRGNGKKQVGFEAAVVQRRIDEHMAYRVRKQQAREEIQRQQERQRAAAQAVNVQAEEDRQIELERIANQNAAMFYNSFGRKSLRLSTRDIRVYR